MPISISGDGSIGSLSATEIGYLDGVTSAVQTQINNKYTTPGVWTSYTPTVTSGSGTFTTVSATGKYIQIGKLVTVQGSVTITTAGTAAGGLYVTVPITALSGGVGFAVELQSTAFSCGCWLNTTTQLHIYKYDSTTIIANSRSIAFGITYEAA